MLDGHLSRVKVFVAEIMNILDKRLDFAQGFALPDLYSALPFSPNLISRKRFSQNRHERAVAREKNTIQVVGLIHMGGCNVQPNQRLARTRNARHEADCFMGFLLCLRNDGRNAICGFAKVDGGCVIARDLFNRMPAIERQRSLDNCRSWAVSPDFPLFRIDILPFCPFQNLPNGIAEQVHIGLDWKEEVRVFWGGSDAQGGSFCFGRNQNWGYKTVVTWLVEVLQVQGVIPDLINGVRRKFFFTDFKLEHKDSRPNQQDNIDALTQSRD